MLMLSNVSWFDGITALCVVIIHSFFGLFLVYKAKKTNAKLLFYAGLMIICEGFMWLWPSTDFLIVLLTGKNSNFPHFLLFLLGWMWAPLSGVFAIYVGADLLTPEKKKYIVSAFLGLVILLFIFFLFDPTNNVNVIRPEKSGEELIKGVVIIGSPASIIIFIMILFIIIFCGCGNLIKGFQSTGVLRKKFLSLSIYWFLTIIFTLLRGFSFPGLVSSFFNIGIIFSLWIFYIGLREEPEEPIKVRSMKEVKVEEGLFRLTKRPAQITEEEVTFHKDQKICLVCKGKVSGYNIFICPTCDALYCQKCALALETLENACWACNSPIDKSKPTKPFKEEEEERGVDASRKPHK